MPDSSHSQVPPDDLLNFGPKSKRILASVGINSFEDLQKLGSVAAFAKVRHSGAKVSLNLLWALEGALADIAWQEVARERRTGLLLALEQYERNV